METIDTFFQSVLRNMARELDLTNNLRIGLNDNQVEEMAVDQLIADLSTTDMVLQWILKYIMDNISDDKERERLLRAIHHPAARDKAGSTGAHEGNWREFL